MEARLETITLFAKEPVKLRDFYRGVFNFHELEYESEAPDLFVLDGKGCRLCIKSLADSRPGLVIQPLELSIEVEDLLQAMRSIKQHGGAILLDEPASNSGAAFYAVDPEGNQLLVEYVYGESFHYYY